MSFIISQVEAGSMLVPQVVTFMTKHGLQLTHYSIEEGGLWFSYIPSNPFGGKGYWHVHSLRFNSGQEWDVINGFRLEQSLAFADEKARRAVESGRF